MAYDNAAWHYGGDYPKELPRENGGTHIGMFIAWAIMNNLESRFHRKESAASLAAVRARQMTGRQFLFEECDERFWKQDLNTKGNAFAKYYYQGASSQTEVAPYLEDYDQTLCGDLPTIYHVEDTWQNYDKIAVVISQRFDEWRQTHHA
jgi:hypothetical protein